MIFETHAHYSDKQFDPDREELLLSMSGQNVGAIIEIGVGRAECEAALEMIKKYPFVYAALGFHPDNVGELNEEVFAWLKEKARTEEKAVAIGEIGLDYHWDVEPREVQKKWFIRQLDLARELNLPVSIHSRDAAQDTLDIVREYGQGLSGSLHCFSYSPEIAQEYIKLGYHIGVGGVVTFKNGRKLKETVAQIPIERILLETDCPYLAPVPYRGKRNHSGYIDYVAAEIAAIKGLTKEEVIRITEENARKVFHL